MNRRYDVIIIGAGVIGAAVALELARKGFKTLNVDLAPAAGYGSTSNSSAIIRTYYSTLIGSLMAYEGYHYWKDWPAYLGASDENGLAEYRECGSLVMKTKTNGYLGKIKAIMDQIGVPYEDLDDAGLKRRMPQYDIQLFHPPKRFDDDDFGTPTGGDLAGAVFFPQSGYVNDPQLAAHNLQRASEAAGAEFLFNRRVIEIITERGRVAGVRLDDGGEIKSPVVVNVGGPHSAKINAMAGVTDDMKITTGALRQEVVYLPSPFPHHDTDGCITSDSDIACYTRPETGNTLVIGSEDPPCDGHEIVDPDNFDTNFTDQWQLQAMRFAQRVPALGIPSRMRGVVALYDVSDDWIPIYDKSSLPGFYMAVGTSGNQFKNAPVAGQLMAALIEAVENGLDHDSAPLQLHLQHTDKVIDAGFFSRKRIINKESSFSVIG